MSQISTTVFICAIMAFTIHNVHSVSVTKLEVDLTEGFLPIDVDDSKVKTMADYAINAISSSSKLGLIKLIRIVKAETQAMAGTNYKLTLELDYGNAGQNAVPLPCEVVVFLHPLTNTRELRQVKCFPNTSNSTKIA